MSNQLPPKVQRKLLMLKKQLRQFLKAFAKLNKQNADYRKYGAKAQLMHALYFEIDALELSAKAEPSGESTTDSSEGTPKEDRKARREKRKEGNEAKRAQKRAEREVAKVERQKQRNDEAGNKEEAIFRFDKLVATWNAIKFDEITDKFREYLDMAENFLTDAKFYISYVETYVPGQFSDKVDQVQDFIKKIERFIAVARNVSDQVDRYAKIVQDVVDITLSLPRKVEDLKDGVVEEATKIFAAAKSLIATADTSDPTVQSNIERLKGYLDKGEQKLNALENLLGILTEDENGDNLPDWYNRIEEKFNAILGGRTDLIPGTKVDDKVLLEIRALKTSMEKFVAAASDKLEKVTEKVEEIKKKLQDVQQWLDQANEFVQAITGFIDNVKEGDLAVIYQDLKDFKDFIDSDKDILQGTKIDDRIKKRLQDASKKAQTWLMNKITKGDPTKEAEVKEILKTVDQLILSTGDVVDHSSKYEKDKDRINIPDITDVSDSQAKEVLERYGIKDPNASYEGILSDMKNQADKTREQVNDKFKASAKRGARASSAFRDAKEEYDQAVKKHNDYFKATNVLGKKIINGLLTIAGVTIDSFAPGAGMAVKTIGQALLGDFTALNREIDKIIPSEFSFIGDLAKDMIPGFLPQIGTELGEIEIEGKTLMMGLNALYVNAITARYKEVIELLNKMKAYASNLGKNLRAVEQGSSIPAEQLQEVKRKVLVLELKWKGLQKDIKDKYVNLNYPPIARDKAYRNASRYLYSVWLIRFPSKEIRIGKSLIKQFDKFGIFTEVGVEWKTGFFSSLGRGFFGFLGVDPMGEREKVAKLKGWANKENNTLKTAKAWSRVF